MPELVFLVPAAFCLRFLVVNHASPAFDSYGHLYFVRELKAQRVGPFGRITINIVGSNGLRAPFLWHWLIALFPFGPIFRFQKWINAGIDAAFSILIYSIALSIGVSARIALFTALLYLLTPMWFSRISIGPRIANFSPRLISELVGNLFFIVTLLPLGFPTWLAAICGVLLSMFVISTSKFGLQAMLFLVPLISLITRDPMPSYAFCLGFILTAILTGGKFLQTLNAQLHHLVWYFKKNLKGEVVVSNRNSFAKLFARPSSGGGALRHAGVICYRALADNSYTAIVLKLPILPIALVLYGISIYVSGSELPIAIVGPVIAATTVFLLVSLPSLLFLGEAERYLNYVAFFIVVMGSMSLVNAGANNILWFLLGYGFLYWAFESFFLQKFTTDGAINVSDASDGVIRHLASRESNTVVLAYPYHAVGVWRIMIETGHHVIYPVGIDEGFRKMFEEKFSADYPFVKLDKLDEIASELGVNILIASKKHLATRGLESWVPSTTWQKLGVGEPIYKVYQKSKG